MKVFAIFITCLLVSCGVESERSKGHKPENQPKRGCLFGQEAPLMCIQGSGNWVVDEAKCRNNELPLPGNPVSTCPSENIQCDIEVESGKNIRVYGAENENLCASYRAQVASEQGLSIWQSALDLSL